MKSLQLARVVLELHIRLRVLFHFLEILESQNGLLSIGSFMIMFSVKLNYEEYTWNLYHYSWELFVERL